MRLPVSMEPRYTVVKQVEKNWVGDFYKATNIIAISFDPDGNFWFWTWISDTPLRRSGLYKLNWQTNIITQQVVNDTGSDFHTIRGMIILSNGAIYVWYATPVSSPYYRLCSCGTTRAVKAPDINDYIWTDEGASPIIDLTDIFRDERDNIFGCDNAYLRYVKRLTTSTYADVCPVRNYANPYNVAHNLKIGASIYYKDVCGFYRIKSPSPSLPKVDPLEFTYDELLAQRRVGITYNHAVKTVYMVYEEIMYPGPSPGHPEYKELLAFATLSLRPS